jgi:hypothetical protein
MTTLRVAVLVLLVWGAYWAALPWLECAWPQFRFGPSFGPSSETLRLCTFGVAEPKSYPGSGFGPNVVIAAVYLSFAVLVATRRRPL